MQSLIRKFKTLYELAESLENKGVNMKIWKNDWKPNCFYKITKIEISDKPKAWGILVWNGKSSSETQIKSSLKNGIWRYELPKPPKK